MSPLTSRAVRLLSHVDQPPNNNNMENVKRRKHLEKQAEILEKELARGEVKVKRLLKDLEEKDNKIQKEKLKIKRIEKLEKRIEDQLKIISQLSNDLAKL